MPILEIECNLHRLHVQVVGDRSDGVHRNSINAEQVTAFGQTPDGTRVDIATISNGGATARVMTWGASLQDFRLAGVHHPLVLGSPVLPPYWGSMLYFGAIVGRVANRIAHGHASLNGSDLTLERNDQGRHTLHGGTLGASGVNWRLDSVERESCQLSVTLPDGQGGFPGNLDICALYSLTAEGALSVDLTAQTDAPTFCNLAHHSYWNLDGHTNVSDHLLWVNAKRYLPVDAAQIPLSCPSKVAHTAFDYRNPRKIADDLDHNFCRTDVEGLRRACTLRAGELRLSVDTTEPGLQVYAGKFIDTRPDLGLTGTAYGRNAGVALEPQAWPNAPNAPEFPSILLNPGEMYHQRSVFHIERIET